MFAWYDGLRYKIGLYLTQTEERNADDKLQKALKLLIDKDMLKKDLAQKAKISPTSIAKLSKNENVNTEILQKICNALDCDICDIMEMVGSSSEKEGEGQYND